MEKNSKIYIAGHNGMVGSAIVRELRASGYENLIMADRKQLDLLDQSAVGAFFEQHRPEYVFLAAAKVGGIKANRDNPADFLYDNLEIQNNIFHFAHCYGVKKLLFLGSSCIYPKDCPQPMKEEYLLTGKLEPTNEGYAIAKIAGLKMAEYFHSQYGMGAISLMPCNLYGPNDSFDPEHSHVLSALVKKFTDAQINGIESVTLWGSGQARREFMHVDDLARISVEMMENYDDPAFVNIGSGRDISIKELAELIAAKTGYAGEIVWDTTMPDGMMKKCMDVSKMNEFGLYTTIALEDGVMQMIASYKATLLTI